MKTLRLPADPRYFQIAVLAALLVYGAASLDFEVDGATTQAILGAALATQWLTDRLGGRRFDPRSPLISALSLCLLLRTASPALAAAAAVLAIGSKALVRVRGKHLFNPSNLGLVAVVLASERAWISPGQWGSAALAAFAFVGLGSLVVRRARRGDVTWAFLAAWVLVVFGRAAWLGDPWSIPLHQLESGSLLLFAFFMISDPKTTPDSRAGRVLFAAAVAAVGGFIQFRLYQSAGPIYALLVAAPLVPLLDRWLPADRYRWASSARGPRLTEETMHTTPRTPIPVTATAAAPAAARGYGAWRTTLTVVALLSATLLIAPATAGAFCGFYVARADTALYNRASQVVIVRDGDRTVLTMANDFQGDPEEFAMVIPVPTRIEREQIHVAERALIEHLDAYTAPRLVEYFDPDPCAVYERREGLLDQLKSVGARAAPTAADAERARALGVRIEATYSVGEYEILILSADESRGLTTWLRESGYRLPDGAERVVGSYLKQGMRFFVAKVDLGRHERMGFSYLRPLQVAFETPKFGLPIRLGTLNADGDQELFVYTLTRSGRVETTNYRTVKLPTGAEIPPFVKDDFGRFYRDLFARQVDRQDQRAVFLEYAWDMAWCDPCAADPLSPAELAELGVFWLGDAGRQAAQNVFVTRLHLSYDGVRFPEDLRFHETGDRENFQGRFVLRHPFQGATCAAASGYYQQVAERRRREAETLASLTGWPLGQIQDRIERTGWPLPADGSQPADGEPWWRRIWSR